MKKLVLVLIFLFSFVGNVYAYDFASWCSSQVKENVQPWVYVKDLWNFYRCECVSYVAYRLNQDGFNFSNQYLNRYFSSSVKWGNAQYWHGVAEEVGFKVDAEPTVGSIAQWDSNENGAYKEGHIAYTTQVKVYDNGTIDEVCFDDYNWFGDSHKLGSKCLKPTDENYPGRFIHFNELNKEVLYCYNLSDMRSICWKRGKNDQCEVAKQWQYWYYGTVTILPNNSHCPENNDNTYIAKNESEIGGLGGGADNTGETTNPPPPTEDNPWTGYKSVVGIDWVRTGSIASGWMNETTYSLSQIKAGKTNDFKIRLKQKGGVWPNGNICAELYITDNKDYRTSDMLIDSDCEDFKSHDPDDPEQSMVIKDIELNNYITQPGTYRFYTRVITTKGNNGSTEGDSDERVKITVYEEGDVPIATRKKLTPAQIAEVLMIIFSD